MPLVAWQQALLDTLADRRVQQMTESREAAHDAFSRLLPSLGVPYTARAIDLSPNRLRPASATHWTVTIDDLRFRLERDAPGGEFLVVVRWPAQSPRRVLECRSAMDLAEFIADNEASLALSETDDR